MTVPPGQYYAPYPTKSKGTAMILEIIPGLFGLFGIGWLYSGNTNVGLLLLLSSFAWWAVVFVVAIFSVGFGLLCTCPAQILFIVLSASLISDYAGKHPEIFTR